MNYDVSSEKLSVCNLVFDGCREIPVDLDFTLPDYCPDVQKILKCRVLPNINSRNISGDRLNIEGIADIRVIYLDSENNHVKCCENSVPFSASIDIKSTPENAITLTSAKVEYVNCRAVSQRKIDIHGALSICAKIYSKTVQNVSCCVNGKDIQQKIKSLTASTLVGIGQQQFTLSEVLDTENSISPELIINSAMVVDFDDYKVMKNKVVAKGEAVLKVLYVSDLSAGKLNTAEYKIPISQIVDAPGATDESRYIIIGEVLGHNEKIYPGNNETKNMISLEAKIAVTVMAYEEKELGVVSDIYSTKYDLEIENLDIDIMHLKSTVNEDFEQKISIPLDNMHISEIIDVWSESSLLNSSFKDDKLIFKNKMNICVLAYDENQTPFYIERTTEFDFCKEMENLSENIICKAKISPKSIGYRLSSEDSIDIKITCNICADIFKKFGLSMVTGASCDESQTIKKDRANSLTIYYADENEQLWDIARKYHTSLQAIKEENDISEETEEVSDVLLIPMK